MLQMGITTGRPNFSYKKYNNLNQPKDPNLKNVNINQVDLGKGMSQNIYLNQGKSPGKLKGHKIKSQRPTSAISTKKIKYNQDLDQAQKNRIIDVNYLHLTKLPESKKFSHVDKAIINPVQSTFSVKNIVDDNIKKHEKMMKPIVLYPDPVRIFNEQPDKILPGTLRRSQEEIEEFEKKNKSKYNMMIIGQGKNTSITCRDNHVVFNKPAENRFKRKATSTKAARNTLLESEDFVKSICSLYDIDYREAQYIERKYYAEVLRRSPFSKNAMAFLKLRKSLKLQRFVYKWPCEGITDVLKEYQKKYSKGQDDYASLEADYLMGRTEKEYLHDMVKQKALSYLDLIVIKDAGGFMDFVEETHIDTEIGMNVYTTEFHNGLSPEQIASIYLGKGYGNGDYTISLMKEGKSL
jgi:hypothetical protein